MNSPGNDSTKMRTITPRFEQLEPRDCPAVINPQIVNITMTDPATAAYLDQGAAVAAQYYLPVAQTLYDVGAGTVAANVNIAPIAGPSVSPAQMVTLVDNLILQGAIPAPSINPLTPTIYNVVLPPGYTDANLSANDAGENFPATINGRQAYLTDVYQQGAEWETVAEMGHEYMEAAVGITQPQWGPSLAFNPVLGRDVCDLYMWSANNYEWGGFEFFALTNYFTGDTPLVVAGQPDPQNGPGYITPPQKPPQVQAQQGVQVQQQAPGAFAGLEALAVEQFDALAYRALSILDPRDFAGAAEAAQQRLASNPLANTPQGKYAEALGWYAFAQAV